MVNNEMVAAGFVYLSNSTVSHLEWLISNPDKKSGKGLLKLTRALVELAKENGCPTVVTNYDNNQENNKGLGRLYEMSGFTKVGKSMTMMVNDIEDNKECFLCEEFFDK